MLGLRRTYLQSYGWGIVNLLTGGMLGIGWLFDAFLSSRLIARERAALIAEWAADLQPAAPMVRNRLDQDAE